MKGGAKSKTNLSIRWKSWRRQCDEGKECGSFVGIVLKILNNIEQQLSAIGTNSIIREWAFNTLKLIADASTSSRRQSKWNDWVCAHDFHWNMRVEPCAASLMKPPFVNKQDSSRPHCHTQRCELKSLWEYLYCREETSQNEEKHKMSTKMLHNS